MRKFIVLTLLVAMSWQGTVRCLWAQNAEENNSPRKLDRQELVNLNASRAEDQLRELERRMDDLEREKRFQDDRIRNLERTVNDLRRER